MWYNNPHCKPICVRQPTVWKNSKLPGGFGSLACTETSNGKLFVSFFFYHQVILNAPAVTAGWSFSSCTSQSAQSAEEGFQTEPPCCLHPGGGKRERQRERQRGVQIGRRPLHCLAANTTTPKCWSSGLTLRFACKMMQRLNECFISSLHLLVVNMNEFISFRYNQAGTHGCMPGTVSMQSCSLNTMFVFVSVFLDHRIM